MLDDDTQLRIKQFLRSIAPDLVPPELDKKLEDTTLLERLSEAGGDSWVPRALEHETWIRHVLVHLAGGHGGPVPFDPLLDGLANAAAGLGARAWLAHCALNARDDLDPGDRELIESAIRDAAIAGARAWARVLQASSLLAPIDWSGL